MKRRELELQQTYIAYMLDIDELIHARYDRYIGSDVQSVCEAREWDRRGPWKGSLLNLLKYTRSNIDVVTNHGADYQQSMVRSQGVVRHSRTGPDHDPPELGRKI